jgi:hypothetical protein
MMSKIRKASDAQNTVVCERKKPTATSTSAKTARKPFGPKHRMELEILGQVDDYNHKMGYVDGAISLQLMILAYVKYDEVVGMRFGSSCSTSPLRTAIAFIS